MNYFFTVKDLNRMNVEEKPLLSLLKLKPRAPHQSANYSSWY